VAPLTGTAIKYETLAWDISPDAAYVRAAQQQRGNYKAAISADIADLTVSLPSDALADAEDASSEVTRFDAELGGEIAPFSSVLLRTESAASSNIENLTASARAIAEAELPGAKTTANAKVIVANTAAMIAAINLAAELPGTGVTVNAFRPGSVDTAMQTWIREQDPDQIGAELHERFTASYQQGGLIGPQQSAESLLAHLGTDAAGHIWNFSDPA